jgi:predicted Zn-dependent peptidase
MKLEGRRTVLAVACLAIIASLSACAGSSGERSRPWEDIPVPELGEIQLPDYERVELDNGMVLYLAEDHELPLVELAATIQVGAIYEPADKIGLAAMTGSVLRTGGTENRTGDEIDALVEAKGMSVETSIGEAQGNAYLSTLSDDTDLGLELLADILRRPVFAEDKIAIAKEEQKAAIARRNDEPLVIARREAIKVLLGPDHPLARQPEYDTIAAVDRQDMIDFHRDYFGPDRMYLVVIGDFDRDAMVRKIEAAFSGWAPAAAPVPPDPEIPDLPRTVNTIAKKGLTQSTVVLGHKGIRNDNPEYAAITVANWILGGSGFSSRLFQEVRTNLGYAYSVGSQAGTGYRWPGTFIAFVMTKNETVEAAIDAILAEIERMRTEPVTEAELQQAKDALLNSEVFNYDSKREILNRLVLFEKYGYPPDFLQRYMEAVKSLTVADIQAAAQKLWHPERLSIIALGQPSEWDGDLTAYGPVNEIDISIPEPSLAMSIPAATPASLEAGKEIMRKLRAKSGGKKFAKLESYYEETNIAAEIQGMPMQFTMQKTVVFPDHLYLVTKTPFGEATQVVAGDKGWATGPMGNKDLTGDELQSARDEITDDMVAMLRELDDFQCQALDPVEVQGVACVPVNVTRADDDEYHLIFVDEESGLVRMIQSPGQSPVTGAPVTMKVYVEEYQELGGFRMPRALKIMHDDEEFATATVLDFQANPSVKPGLFEK